MKSFLFVVAAALLAVQASRAGGVALEGELRKWHKITLRCTGPETSETSVPNPFTDYRLDVTFSHPASGRVYRVPGYFAADGDAANTGATAGNVWLVHFSPDATGTWNYTVSFRGGEGIAVSGDPAAGDSAGGSDGAMGSFEVEATDKTGRDLRGKGRLQYVGRHHLRFAETGEFYLKCGTDSPENLLAYADFDDTPNAGNRRKTWSAHLQDYDEAEAAEYTWSGSGGEPRGRGLLGAVHYISSEGLNGISFLSFSLDGDDDNVFPHLINSEETFGTSGADTRWDAGKVHHTRFDVSKLAQWEKVFSYATMKGLFLHFKTQETENDQKMDGGDLGLERRVYYRELVARFSHHLAVEWNLGEENSNTDEQRRAFAQWFNDNDPYRHLVVMHTYGTSQNGYIALLGGGSKLSGASLQPDDDAVFSRVFPESKRWVDESTSKGRPWVVACDEPGLSSEGLRPDSDAGSNHHFARLNALWGNVMAGGGGVAWYFGSGYSHSDMTCQDFRSRHSFWPDCRIMLDFWMNRGIPFHEMVNDDSLVDDPDSHCLHAVGEQYVVHLKGGGSTSLDLTEVAGTFEVLWYDPRIGGNFQQGTVTTLAGGTDASIGSPPSDQTEDWLALVRQVTANTPPVFGGLSLSTKHQTPATISVPKLLFAVSDNEGDPVDVTSAGPASASGGAVTLGAGSLVYTPPAGFSGTDSFFVTVSDASGASTSGMVSVVVGPSHGGGGPGLNPPQLVAEGGTMVVSFHAIPGFQYSIQRSVDLSLWETIYTGTADSTGRLEFVDANPPEPQAYYRLDTP
ncbi:DUF5060 domain-containing protein [Luteolibacter marinus]|uniref:DUF5060 domain-containing protein n=1 Tax=Luteolibacter marinus TaxID=2776705 RepID=UPI001866283C|nr:DUF5060 domain-containing protein [Luteolibacter marinus]